MSENKGLSSLVLGGGFLGTNLARRLARSGGQVRLISRTLYFRDALSGVECVEGKMDDTDLLADCAAGMDTIFHVLGASTPDSANLSPADELSTTVGPTLRFFESLAHSNTRVIFISSGGTIYGKPATIPVPETAPNWPQTAYGVGKMVVERYLALYHRLYGLDYRILRVANPYGPYQIARRGQGAIAAFVEHALKNEPISIWGDGSVIRDYVYVDDAVEAMLSAARTDSTQRLFNIGSGAGVSLRELVDTIGRLLQRELTVSYEAGRPVDIPKSILDVSRAEAALDWSADTTLEEGLKRTIAWMAGHLSRA